MTDFSRASAPLLKGALVQLTESVVGFIVPNVVVFQFNPKELSHTITPWNPQAVDQTQRGAQAPMVQPHHVQESFSFTLELDATDGAAFGSSKALTTGVADRLAALKKLTYPSEGLFGDLVRNASALAGSATCQIERPKVPVVLLVWGPGRIVPVRVTSFSVTEKWHTRTLHPLHADVSLGLEVMTPDAFRSRMTLSQKIATAAYNYTRVVDDVLAILNLENTASDAAGLPPFM